MTQPTLAVTTPSADLLQNAQTLADSLALPLATSPDAYDYLLELTPTHLGLNKQHSKLSPLIIDFQSGKMDYRRTHATFRNEILVRALGLKNHTQPFLVDTTAGLGRDSFILASLGFNVTLLERSPIIHALLHDGLLRAAKNPALAAIIQRLHLIQTDAKAWLTQQSPIPDIIYLDPMFPDRKKTAAVKKDMQIFQEIMGEDTDAAALLACALTCATKRVVVKRPRLADPIAGPAPSFTLTGSSSRFDIYLI